MFIIRGRGTSLVLGRRENRWENHLQMVNMSPRLMTMVCSSAPDSASDYHRPSAGNSGSFTFFLGTWSKCRVWQLGINRINVFGTITMICEENCSIWYILHPCYILSKINQYNSWFWIIDKIFPKIHMQKDTETVGIAQCHIPSTPPWVKHGEIQK